MPSSFESALGIEQIEQRRSRLERRAVSRASRAWNNVKHVEHVAIWLRGLQQPRKHERRRVQFSWDGAERDDEELAG